LTGGRLASYVGFPTVLRPRLLSALLATSLFFAARSPRADVAPDAAAADARRQVVVAHVGPRAIAAGDLEDRLARVPRYQLRTFGKTAPEVVRGYFDKVFLRDVLLSLGAEEKHIDQQIDIEQSLDRTLSGATLRALIATVGPNNAITPEEVQAYYDANRIRFEAKDRVSIWRILCATRPEAQTVLDAAKKDGTVATFTKLSRDHNIDKATFLRGGNLGFVGEGGVSSEPGILVETAVLRAAQGVKDGEIVPTVVPEGPNFAVVWRRGSQTGLHRSVVDARPQIQDTLIRQKREAAEKALLEKLRAEKVKDLDESLLGSFDISVDDGTIGPRKRARTVPSR
jgi:peptidyl-prolyl cis-trans isomerase C